MPTLEAGSWQWRYLSPGCQTAYGAPYPTEVAAREAGERHVGNSGTVSDDDWVVPRVQEVVA
jgi:hypothetical protein